MMPPRLAGLLFALVALISGGAYGSYTYFVPAKQPVTAIAYATPEESDAYVRFDMEAYDSILKNYWKKVPEADLAQLFQQSLQKASSSSTPLTTNARKGTAKMLS